MRWADVLAEFNFELQYRPGKQAVRPDALSRREQDMPQDNSDERISHRFRTMFGSVMVRTGRRTTSESELEPDPKSLDFETSVRMFEDYKIQ